MLTLPGRLINTMMHMIAHERRKVFASKLLVFSGNIVFPLRVNNGENYFAIRPFIEALFPLEEWPRRCFRTLA